jgi:TetR/AcrR family transcriptional repressor of nem operon
MRLFSLSCWNEVRRMSKGESTRQRIIVKAAPLFNQKGFSGCSMQDIMEATGLEKGGLYRHFRSKEELAAEVFRYTLSRNQKIRSHPAEPGQGAIEQLRATIARFIAIPSAVPGGCPLLNTAVESDDGNPLLRGLAREGVQEWKARLAGIVAGGIEMGEIRPETEPRAVANTIIATLEGALMISRLECSRTALQDAQAALSQILDGIAASPA